MKLLRPLGSRVMVEIIETERENVSAGGIALPGGPKRSADRGKVLKIGDDVRLDIVEGNIVFFDPGAAFGLNPDDKVKLIHAGSIHAVLEE